MVSNNIIIDSSAWVAILHTEDSDHKKALGYKDLFIQEQTIPDIIFYETLTVLKNKLSNTAVVDNFIQYSSSSHITVRLYYEYNQEVLKLFTQNISKDLSYTDTLLLYLSKDNYILTFDKRLQKAIKNFGGKVLT